MSAATAEIKAAIGGMRLTILDEKGAEALAKVDEVVAALVAPIVAEIAKAKNKTLSEGERAFATIIVGIAVLTATAAIEDL